MKGWVGPALVALGLLLGLLAVAAAVYFRPSRPSAWERCMERCTAVMPETTLIPDGEPCPTEPGESQAAAKWDAMLAGISCGPRYEWASENDRWLQCAGGICGRLAE